MAKTFEKWRIGELHHTFGIKQNYKMPLLEEWLASRFPSKPTEIQRLNQLKENLQRKAHIWNEDELKFFFISQLIDVVNFVSEDYQVFTQRSLSAEVNGIKINGIVDFVIAKGIDEPEKPFFFLHEYKQEKKSANDPLAQLLAEMLAAQAQNESEMPLYGCYVMGRFWFFIVLEGNEYAISNAYNSSDEDIFQIVNILRAVKTKIEESIKREQNK
jgi:hypothetical protein